MALVRQTREGIKLVIKRKFDADMARRYPSARLRTVAREVALKEIELIRRRTESGLDKNGKQMRATSARYQAFKKQFIASGYKLKGRSTQVTAFAADRPGQFMRLTGRMFSDMYVRDLKVSKRPTGYVVDYVLDFKTGRSKKIAGYHNGQGRVLRPFWGAAKAAADALQLQRIWKRGLR